ncbi:response regulator transcription factor (plasmid) [Deinococcus radiomollis]|uniref:response regulator transcription factor n=1 Tax=Deinococcus radiomollis TaxID=468916 RepID=UPI00389287A6
MLIGGAAAQAEWLATELLNAGHEVTVTSSAMHGLMIARASRPALVITDLVLPDGSGTDVIVRLSRTGISVIVIGRDDPETEVSVLEMGAVAYLSRPLEVHELLARVALEVRKHGLAPSGDVLVVGNLRLDVQWRMLIIGKKQMRLSASERNLLAVLMRESGRVFTVEELIECAWGAQVSLTSRMVAVCVSSLRRKLRAEGAHRYLETVHGVGYVVRDQG